MKIAFVSLRTPSHVAATATLARKLKARGHDVVFISTPDAEPLMRASNLRFIPYCEKELPLGSARTMWEQLNKLQGDQALAFTMKQIAYGLQASFDNLPRTLKETKADFVVLDHVQLGLGLVPMDLGMPYVHISSAFHFDFSGNTPFCIFDDPYDSTQEGLARSRQSLFQALKALQPITSVSRAYAEQRRMPIDWSDPFATVSRLGWLTQTPREFDFPSDHWPSFFHHTGPFHDGEGRADIPFPWERLTGQRLIYASMGTLQNGLESVFSRIADSVRNCRELQLVLSIGPGLSSEQIKNLPPNAIVVNQAPQLALLKQSALCITHAGLNTALESLANGVPMVAIPITNDQPGVAARIAYTGTGRFVRVNELNTSQLETAVDEVLNDPRYSQNALTMKRAISETNGLEKAIDLLEGAITKAHSWVS